MCRALAHDHGGRGSPAPAAPRADPARTVEPHPPGHARVRCGTRHSDHQPRVKATIENTTATRTPDNRLRRARVTRSGTCDSRCSGSVSTRLIHQSPDPRQKGECSHRGTRAGTEERAPRQTTRCQRSWAPRRFHPRPLRGPVFIPLNTRGSIGALCVTVSYPMIVAWNFRQILRPRPSRCRGS
jgi:hypothetical protein